MNTFKSIFNIKFVTAFQTLLFCDKLKADCNKRFGNLVLNFVKTYLPKYVMDDSHYRAILNGVVKMFKNNIKIVISSLS